MGKKEASFFVGFLLFLLGLSVNKKEENMILRPNFFFGTVFLLILYFGNKHMFFQARDNFEFRPYITEVYYNIASKYSEITIYGHNFREMPFMGKVYINGNTQNIREWDDDKIVVEIDPILSKSGNLMVVNDYGFGKHVKSNVKVFEYFDSGKTNSSQEKRFWETLKETATKRSKLYGQNE